MADDLLGKQWNPEKHGDLWCVAGDDEVVLSAHGSREDAEKAVADDKAKGILHPSARGWVPKKARPALGIAAGVGMVLGGIGRCIRVALAGGLGIAMSSVGTPIMEASGLVGHLYGHHFVSFAISAHIADTVFVNAEGYSPETERHQAEVVASFRRLGFRVILVNLACMQDLDPELGTDSSFRPVDGAKIAEVLVPVSVDPSPGIAGTFHFRQRLIQSCFGEGEFFLKDDRGEIIRPKFRKFYLRNGYTCKRPASASDASLASFLNPAVRAA